eukprot:scaffold89123_cov48-Phaeocystis_antarctica.AAC.2
MYSRPACSSGCIARRRKHAATPDAAATLEAPEIEISAPPEASEIGISAPEAPETDIWAPEVPEIEIWAPEIGIWAPRRRGWSRSSKRKRVSSSGRPAAAVARWRYPPGAASSSSTCAVRVHWCMCCAVLLAVLMQCIHRVRCLHMHMCMCMHMHMYMYVHVHVRAMCMHRISTRGAR